MPTVFRPSGISATMTRIAVRDAARGSAAPAREADPFESAGAEPARRYTGAWGPASEYFPSPLELIAAFSPDACGVAVAAPLAALGPYWWPYIIDPSFCHFDPHDRPYTAQMFEDEPGYVTRFLRAMNYVESPDFDVRQFDCIKRLYEIGGHQAELCIPSRAYEVTPIYQPAMAQRAHMRQDPDRRVCFNCVNQRLIIKSGAGELSTHRFRASVEPARKARFVERLVNDGNVFREKKLVSLFEGVSEPLRQLRTWTPLVRYCRHGPGFTEAYFPDHRFPSDFAERSRPREDEVPPLRVAEDAIDEGTVLVFYTTYEDEAQIRALFESRLQKFRIPVLETIACPVEQIALIAGFVSEMANAHPFSDANNRTWIQIILNHLLRRCGQTDAILAVPNGFAAKVRYDLGAASQPEPGTPAYIAAMRDAVSAIQDGQRYYESLCRLSSLMLANLPPDCWL